MSEDYYMDRLDELDRRIELHTKGSERLFAEWSRDDSNMLEDFDEGQTKGSFTRYYYHAGYVQAMEDVKSLFNKEPVKGWDPDTEDAPPDREEAERRAKESMLQSLREGYKMSDEQVLALAESGQLPVHPPFALWITLLGRSELLYLHFMRQAEGKIPK